MKNIYKAGKDTGAKIKQFVITRPKLHKVLKAIKIVVNVLVYGFTIFMIIGLCIGTSYKNDNTYDGASILEAPSYSAYHSADYDCNLYYYGSDLGNTAFYEGLFTLYNQTEDGQWWPLSLYDLKDAPVGHWEDFYFETTSQTSMMPLGFVLDWYEFTTPQLLENYNDQNHAFNSFVINVIGTSNNSFSYGYLKQVSIECQLCLNWAERLTIKSQIKYYFNSSNSLIYYEVAPVDTYNKFVLVNKTIHNGFGADYFANDIFDRIFEQSSYYQGAYHRGYEDGYRMGFNQDNGSNDAFTLIKGSFYAIADILNINVLPHLTLGVLIFAPLIVTLIIVIVKMVRG